MFAMNAAPRARSLATVRRVLAALLALALLNTLLAMRNWWPTPAVLPDARLAPEFVALWVLLLAAVAWRGALSNRALAWLAIGTLGMVLGRYFDVTVPALFGRAVNLYWDGQQIPRFLWVSARDYPWWVSVAFVAALVAVFAALYLAIRWALGVLAREAAPYAVRARWTWAVTAAAVVTVVAHLTGVVPSVTWHLVTHPVTPTYARQAVLLGTALLPGGVERVLPPSTALDTALSASPQAALGALRGRDFKLVFLESYGAMAFDHPRVAPQLAASREHFAQQIAASGRVVASGFVRAATFAGASELSHLSLLSGIDLTDPLRHDLLLTTDRPTLITLFRRAGYQSVGLYPALSWDWAESRFYGFDLFLDGRDLDYRGPPLGYWKIPDQFTLARVEQLLPRDATARPRFLFFPTITSHLPFGPVPPYQPDWQRLLTPDPFGAEESQRLLASFVDWIDMLPNYVRMFDYTYRWLGGWLQQPEPRESVILLVGDHQPAATVSGEGASWEVPVHLITRDPALLERFVALGFKPGLEPQRPALGGMHDLTALLLQAFTEPLPLHAAPAIAVPVAGQR
ncbi:MAG: sulfatase-like hydrolase/transferase [Burkholderiaceae bacterium]|nr:sulfatase-like hydrolase/transferase [Burkholderiaceae bacterium]